MSFLHKIIFNIGTRVRNPSYKKALKILNNEDYSSRGKIEMKKFERLKDLLIFSNEYSDYYRNVFSNIGFDPKNDLNTIDDLYKLPLMDKAELRLNISKISTAENFKFNKLFKSETSGFSGEPLLFYRNEEWDSFHRASITRGLNWHGVEPHQKHAYFWGYSLKGHRMYLTKLNDFLLNRKRIFTYSDDALNSFIEKNKDVYFLSGYSSMIYEVAKKCESRNISFNNLKLIKGTSEKIYDEYSSVTKSTFGMKISSEYGAAEAGIIAFECPEGKMHVNEEMCIVEVIQGEAVITNLHSKSLPIIRYKLGDAVILDNEGCKCGRQTLIIKEITGRIGKKIYGSNGKSFPSLTLYYIFKNIAVKHDINLNYKAVQNKKGLLYIYIQEKLRLDDAELIKKYSYEYFGDSIELVIEGDKIIHDKTKKKTDFETTLVE